MTNESLETSAAARSTSYADEKPPGFGHPLLKYFSFEPDYINLNIGSYGSLPAPVSKACKAIADEVEANPDKFIRLTYEPLWTRCRERTAKLLGAEVDECVLVPCTTHGVFTVLRNFDWKKGDVIIKTNVTYIGVDRSVQYFGDLDPCVTVETVDIGSPYTLENIFKDFETVFNKVQNSSEYRGLTERGMRPKIVVVVDALSSNPGLLMPWERVVKFCKGHSNVFSLVDAAHAIGQIVGLNLSEIKPDFWVSNCHKWLYAKRGCAVLYVPREKQHLIYTTLPTSTNYESSSDNTKGPTILKPQDFVKQFEWTGTHDPTPYLSIGPALDFREWLGGEKEINDYCRARAIEGGKALAKILGTEQMDQTPNHELTLNMVNVKLPLPQTPKKEARAVIDGYLKKKLLLELKVFAPPFYHNDCWWVRACAQVWNELSDFERLGEAYKKLCSDVKKDIIDENGELKEG